MSTLHTDTFGLYNIGRNTIVLDGNTHTQGERKRERAAENLLLFFYSIHLIVVLYFLFYNLK